MVYLNRSNENSKRKKIFGIRHSSHRLPQAETAAMSSYSDAKLANNKILSSVATRPKY